MLGGVQDSLLNYFLINYIIYISLKYAFVCYIRQTMTDKNVSKVFTVHHRVNNNTILLCLSIFCGSKKDIYPVGGAMEL